MTSSDETQGIAGRIQKAGALIFSDKKLLIVKPLGKPFWINPGGKYEREETAEKCLERELREELQVKLVSSSHWKTYEIGKAAHSDHPLRLELYFVEIEGELHPSSEIEKIAWLSKEDFVNKIYNLAPSFSIYVPELIQEERIN